MRINLFVSFIALLPFGCWESEEYSEEEGNGKREGTKNAGNGIVGDFLERKELQKQRLFKERQIKELQTTFISIDETPRGQKFYWGELENERTEIDFSEIGQGLRNREGWQVVLRVAPKVPHAEGLDWIVANQKKEWKSVNVYEWYYHAQACFEATGVSGGAKYWRAWNKDFQQIVCGAQQPDGHWPHGAHFHGDTAISRTTMTILMLEVYYRYMPSAQI